MTHDEIVNSCKFYKGEDKCPYPIATPEAVLWEAEECWVDRAKNQYIIDRKLDEMNVIKHKGYYEYLDSNELSQPQQLTLYIMQEWITRRKLWDDSIVDVWLKA